MAKALALVMRVGCTRGLARAFPRSRKSGASVPALVNAVTPLLGYRNTGDDGNKKNVCIHVFGQYIVKDYYLATLHTFFAAGFCDGINIRLSALARRSAFSSLPFQQPGCFLNGIPGLPSL